jgi:hypothetical protein
VTRPALGTALAHLQGMTGHLGHIWFRLGVPALLVACDSYALSSASDDSSTDGSVDASFSDEPADSSATGPDAGPSRDRTGCIEGYFAPYRGDLHNHTSYSADFDGPSTGDPAAAFRSARDHGLDFFAVTDHLKDLSASEYSQCRSVAEAANEPGAFAAISGYEAEFGGHGMFLFAWTLSGVPTSRSQYFDRIEACGECIGQFNHPAGATFPWLDFSYLAAADQNMELIELNGTTTPEARLGAYVEALDAGWSVSPSWNSDTHLDNWGSGTNRTIVYPTTLSREHLRDAMHAHRTSASNDRNTSLVLEADGCWMGSSLPGWTTAPVEVVATDDEASDGFASVRLIGPGGAELGILTCDGSNRCEASRTIDLAPPTWVLAVATETDGDLVVSAPIWFGRTGS